MLVVAVVLASLAPGWAEKITIDPNSLDGRAALAKAQAKEDISDPRLARKVTYTAKRKCASEVLSDLSAMTGITLNAGYNEKDWQVRDRRMNVFAKDLPLADLMNSIARTMKFGWREDGEPGRESYRLYMDRAAVLRVEMKRKKEAEAVAKQLKEARQRLFDSLQQVADLPADEVAGLNLPMDAGVLGRGSRDKQFSQSVSGGNGCMPIRR